MAVYSISDVEKLTGVRAPTLRAWEQRHGLIEPERGEYNTRHYGEKDISELFHITLLKKHGYRIGEIGVMTPAERRHRVAVLTDVEPNGDIRLDALTLATLSLDDYKLGLMLDTNIGQRGLEETMLEVIYPLLEKLGVLYFTGTIGATHERFVAGLIQQKILAATDALPYPSRTKKVAGFGVFLPRGERQELSSLFVQYILRKRGFQVVYLGAGLDAEHLGRIGGVRRLDYLLTVLSGSYAEQPVDQLVDDILARCPTTTLLLAGQQVRHVDLSRFPRAKKLVGVKEVIAFSNLISKT